MLQIAFLGRPIFLQLAPLCRHLKKNGGGQTQITQKNLSNPPNLEISSSDRPKLATFGDNSFPFIPVFSYQIEARLQLQALFINHSVNEYEEQRRN